MRRKYYAARTPVDPYAAPGSGMAHPVDIAHAFLREWQTEVEDLWDFSTNKLLVQKAFLEFLEFRYDDDIVSMFFKPTGDYSDYSTPTPNGRRTLELITTRIKAAFKAFKKTLVEYPI